MKCRKFTVVLPVYYNATTLEAVMKELDDQVLNLPSYYGHVCLVDDGSKDESWEVMKKIKAVYGDRVSIIKLSRNFGEFNAMLCGIASDDEVVICTTADGQNPTNVIPKMLDLHFDQANEIVIATRESREENAWRRWSSRMVFRTIQRLANKDMPVGGFDYFLLGCRAKKELLAKWQPNTFLQVRILELGFSRAFIGYHYEDRKGGISRWTFPKKVTYMIDGVLGHSYVPIRAVSVLGFVFAVVGFVLGLCYCVSWFYNGNMIRGWTSIFVLLLVIGGLQMVMIGMLGEYIWRVLAQVRQSPPYIIDEER